MYLVFVLYAQDTIFENAVFLQAGECHKSRASDIEIVKIISLIQIIHGRIDVEKRYKSAIMSEMAS